MADLSDFEVTDRVDDVLAATFNKILATALRAEYANTETISATKELADSDTQIQILTASGSDQDVELAPEATTNHVTVIYNPAGASYDLVVKDDAGSTTYETLDAGEWAFCVPMAGSVWVVEKFPITIPDPYTGPTVNASTITTSNLTCAEDNIYNCTIAGLTADRNAVLPAPTAAGKIIRLNILDGDADYELVVIGDTGVTINGGSAATEWSRLFIAGESVTLESTSTSNWQVIQDGRIPCKVRIENTDAQSIPNNSITVVVFDEISKNIGGGADTANYRINIRRDGYCIVSCGVRLDGISAAGTAFVVTVQDNAGARVATDERVATNGRYPAAAISAPQDFSAGQYVEATAYQNTGAAQNTMVASTQIQYLALTEILA